MSIASPPKRPSESDELARQIDRIELDHRRKEISPTDRKNHAELIRNLLVIINVDFKKRYGTPPLKVDGVQEMVVRESSRDVEMTAA